MARIDIAGLCARRPEQRTTVERGMFVLPHPVSCTHFLTRTARFLGDRRLVRLLVRLLVRRLLLVSEAPFSTRLRQWSQCVAPPFCASSLWPHRVLARRGASNRAHQEAD